MRLANKDIKMVDTVGFDDSSGTDIPEKTLLGFLADTEKANFYPPLIILQTLSALEKDLVKKMASIFQDVVIGLRMDDRTTINEKRQEIIDQCGISPLKILPLQTFLSVSTTVSQTTQNLYKNDVEEILNFYETVEPSREKLDFSSPLLFGSRQSRVTSTETDFVDIEIITQDVRPEPKPEEVPKNKTTTSWLVGKEDDPASAKTLTKKSVFYQGMACLSGAVGVTVAMAEVLQPQIGLFMIFASSGLSLIGASIGSAAVMCDKDKPVVQCRVKKTFRRTREREVVELWRVFDCDVRIFEGREYGQWEQVGDDKLLSVCEIDSSDEPRSNDVESAQRNDAKTSP